MYIKNSTLKKVLKIVIILGIVPLVFLTGPLLFNEKSYIFVSSGVVASALLLFICGIEDKLVGSRRMVVVAVMIAICVVGRFVPLFKPITALTMITAMYLGGESGFLVGSMSALISNFYFGQGPWTPFQMLAWGIIGLLSGVFSKQLKSHKPLLLVVGILFGAGYSLIMDVWTVLWYNGEFNVGLYLTAFVTSLPHTVLYAVSNFVFLLSLSKPIGEKLNRVKIKYGI